MRTTTKLALLLVLLAASAAPSIGAVTAECLRSLDAGPADVVIVPSGVFAAYTPRCVVIENGDSVTFASLDAAAHNAARQECFTTPILALTRASSTVAFAYDADRGTLTTTTDGVAEECIDFEQTDAGIVVDYLCTIHGALMTGRVVVEV